MRISSPGPITAVEGFRNIKGSDGSGLFISQDARGSYGATSGRGAFDDLSRGNGAAEQIAINQPVRAACFYGVSRGALVLDSKQPRRVQRIVSSTGSDGALWLGGVDRSTATTL
jgi:hypothetical protein